jgi:hypothetical protein
MQPVSLSQIQAFLERKKRPTQFYQYRELPDDPIELAGLLLRQPGRFLFFTQNDGEEVGHWTAMRRRGKDICWFSSYGFLPDGELLISADMRRVPGQQVTKISKALEYLRSRGFTIHYSAVPLQSVDDGTVSCGIWVLMFLTAKIDNFEDFERRIALISTPEKYAQAIYKREISGEQ